MTFLNRTLRLLRRGFDAVVGANVRYTRIVHGDRALADRGAPASSERRTADAAPQAASRAAAERH